MIQNHLRRLRPLLFPKNSSRERGVRLAWAFYSRALNRLRGYGRWRKINEPPEAIQPTVGKVQFFAYQTDDSVAQRQEAFSACSAEWLLIASAPLQLAPSALAEVERAVQAYPQADLVYSDGDHLDRRGGRCQPWMKPAFGIEALRAQNYIAPFFAIRKALGDAVGWFDPAAGSAWAEDLIWRVAEQARQVLHLPKVLYHQTEARPVSFRDEQRALEAHLERSGCPAQTQAGPAPQTFRLQYRLRDQPLISIIIPNHDLPDDLRRCVASILAKSAYSNFEILILENNSREAETFQLYKQLQAREARVRVVEYHQTPFNYAEINNFGARHARGEMLLFLNNDTEVISPDWLERMLEYAQRPEVGAVGAKLYYPQDLIQHVGVILGMRGAGAHHFVNYPRQFAGDHNNVLLPQNFSMVTAACLMTRRQVFEQVGGFDAAYRLAFNDFDLCLKIRERGYRVVWTPYAELYHHEALSRGYDSNTAMFERLEQERQTFMNRWHSLLQAGDPYYNPNLALDRGYFSLRPGRCVQSPRAMPGLGFSPDENPPVL